MCEYRMGTKIICASHDTRPKAGVSPSTPRRKFEKLARAYGHLPTLVSGKLEESEASNISRAEFEALRTQVDSLTSQVSSLNSEVTSLKTSIVIVGGQPRD